jgi:hypothetical protein
VFAWDWIMAPLTGRTVDRAMQAMERSDFWAIGYALIDQLTEKAAQRAGALIDCVARDRTEARWAATAARHGAPFFVVECTCADENLHRRRIEGRTRHPGLVRAALGPGRAERDAPTSHSVARSSPSTPVSHSETNLARVARLRIGKDERGRGGRRHEPDGCRGLQAERAATLEVLHT